MHGIWSTFVILERSCPGKAHASCFHSRSTKRLRGFCKFNAPLFLRSLRHSHLLESFIESFIAILNARFFFKLFAPDVYHADDSDRICESYGAITSTSDRSSLELLQTWCTCSLKRRMPQLYGLQDIKRTQLTRRFRFESYWSLGMTNVLYSLLTQDFAENDWKSNLCMLCCWRRIPSPKLKLDEPGLNHICRWRQSTGTD